MTVELWAVLLAVALAIAFLFFVAVSQQRWLGQRGLSASLRKENREKLA